MTRYVGLDVHKRFIVACGLNPDGTVAFRHRFDCTPQAIALFGQNELTRDDHVALEVTTHSTAVARLLIPLVGRVVVSNPTRTKAIAAATVKTDAVDARTLADLLRSNYLPEVWMPDFDTERLRRIVSLRAQLTGTSTRYINRIRSILQQLMITPPARRLDARSARQMLETAQLPASERLEIDTLLQLIDATTGRIDQVDATIATMAEEIHEVRLLMTLPGIGALGAVALWSAIGDISRFPSANHLVGYLGLAPRIKQSGNHAWYGKITKAGAKEARRLLVLASHHLKTHDGPLGDFYRRLREHKHGSVAGVAAARKMVEIAFHMLKNNEPYRYAQPERTQAKLDKIHTMATGTRRERTPVHVAPEHEETKPEEPGYRREVRRSLNEVYERVGLPVIMWDQLSPGESRATAQTSEYIESLKVNRAIYRKIRAN
jgi:transposase